MIKRIMTAEEFAEQRYDLPEGGRWCELLAGESIALDPPTDEHGTIVMNLSKALAAWIQETRIGYACFELGVVVQRAPDTVLNPPISYFVTGDRWAEMDKIVTETAPALVFEVGSTPGRRRAMKDRVETYRDAGVCVVIVVDPHEKRVAVHKPGEELDVLKPDDELVSRNDWQCEDHEAPLLHGFSVPVDRIFQQPEWWSGPRGT